MSQGTRRACMYFESCIYRQQATLVDESLARGQWSRPATAVLHPAGLRRRLDDAW